VGAAAAPAAAGGAGDKTPVAVDAGGHIIESDADRWNEYEWYRYTSFDTMGLHADLQVSVAPWPRETASD